MTTPDINKILKASPRNCKFGAPMGAASGINNPEFPLYVQKIRLIDGDYAADGTYWGGSSEPLWCAFSVEGSNRDYIRAVSREEVVKTVLFNWPGAKVYGRFGRVLTSDDIDSKEISNEQRARQRAGTC